MSGSATQYEDDEIGRAAEESGCLFVKDVTKIDCAFFDPAAGIIGQSWHVDVDLTGAVDANGFVYDFSDLKKLVRTALNSTVDHALLIPVGSQGINYTETPHGEHWHLHAKARMSHMDHRWEYKCPKGAVYPIRAVAVRQPLVEQEVSRLLRHRLPSSVHAIRVKLREESLEATEASFRYTHGITNHQGLCQRLFHGHKSRIEVYVGHERRPDLEHFVVRELFGNCVHIATPEQIQSGPYEIGMRGPTDEPVKLAFQGTLGHYEAVIPSDRVFVVEKETSIENLTRQIALILKKREVPRQRLRVVCYEGIDKGSIAEL